MSPRGTAEGEAFCIRMLGQALGYHRVATEGVYRKSAYFSGENIVKIVATCGMLTAGLVLAGVGLAGSSAYAQAAGGQTSVGSDVPRCPKTYGTIAIGGGDEDTNRRLNAETQLNSIVPLLRNTMLQSNCFTITAQANNRSKAALGRLKSEAGTDDYRANKKSEKGQQVVSDFYMDPIVNFAGSSKTQIDQRAPPPPRPSYNSNLSGLLGPRGAALVNGLSAIQSMNNSQPQGGGYAGGGGRSVVQNGSAQVTLEVYEVRSEVLIASATGNGTASAPAGVRADLAGASADTPGARAVAAAIDDAYRKLVPAIINYRAQHVRGGLGNGGSLPVD